MLHVFLLCTNGLFLQFYNMHASLYPRIKQFHHEIDHELSDKRMIHFRSAIFFIVWWLFECFIVLQRVIKPILINFSSLDIFCVSKFLVYINRGEEKMKTKRHRKVNGAKYHSKIQKEVYLIVFNRISLRLRKDN